MRFVDIAELEDELSEQLRAVAQGDEVIVKDRDRPIARIVSMGVVPLDTVMVPPRAPFATVRGRGWPAAGWSLRSGELLTKERADR